MIAKNDNLCRLEHARDVRTTPMGRAALARALVDAMPPEDLIAHLSHVHSRCRSNPAATAALRQQMAGLLEEHVLESLAATPGGLDAIAVEDAA